MEISTIVTLVTIVVTFVCGLVAKRVDKFNDKLIPIQNLLIGIISTIIYYLISKDFDVKILATSLGTGGAYDIFSNLSKLIK